MLARQQWSHRDLRWKHRYLDLVHDNGNGGNTIDYSVFHEVQPVDESGHFST